MHRSQRFIDSSIHSSAVSASSWTGSRRIPSLSPHALIYTQERFTVNHRSLSVDLKRWEETGEPGGEPGRGTRGEKRGSGSEWRFQRAVYTRTHLRRTRSEQPCVCHLQTRSEHVHRRKKNRLELSRIEIAWDSFHSLWLDWVLPWRSAWRLSTHDGISFKSLKCMLLRAFIFPRLKELRGSPLPVSLFSVIFFFNYAIAAFRDNAT